MNAELQDAVTLATDYQLETAISVTGVELEAANQHLKNIIRTSTLDQWSAALRERNAVEERYYDLVRQAGRV